MSRAVATLIVLAKAPVAGRVKTRLCPPCTPADAAALARAALIDTLAAVVATPAARRVLVLDGDPGPWVPPEFDVLPQVDGGLGERLAAAFGAVTGPAVLIGMDTPQVTPELLGEARCRLEQESTDAVLGLADDGGYWAIGLREPMPQVFAGVPMSTASTGRRQLEQLYEHGCRVHLLESLRDVDRYEDATTVAAAAPATRFAAELSAIEERLARV